MRRNEGTDEVVRTCRHSVQVVLGIVALIKDDRDVLGAVGKLTIPFDQSFGKASERGRVGLVPWIGSV